MSSHIFRASRKRRIALKLIFSVLLGTILFSALSFDSYADENQVTSTSTLSHTHRGDTISGGSCYETPIYNEHVHTGNTANGEGCYTVANGAYTRHTHVSSCYRYWTEEIYCGSYSGTFNPPDGGDPSHCGACGHCVGWTQCNGCGRPLTGTPCGNVTGTVQRSDTRNCNGALNDGYVTTYSLGCNKTSGIRYESDGIESYELSCPYAEGDYGTITFTNATSDWTTGNVTLIGEVGDTEGLLLSGGFGELSFGTTNGNIVQINDNGIEVSENGIYTMSLSVDDKLFDTAAAEIQLTVSNIDRTAPTITDVSVDSSEWVQENTIVVNASDLQPDGSLGSGLAPDAYSFDNGASWVNDNSFVVTTNTTVYIKVKDNCGNIAETSVEVTNVDSTGPEISISTSTTVWYEGDSPRPYTVTATDSDCGLAEKPYSYDGGITWTDLNTTFVDSPGEFSVLVRDALGNISEQIIVNKADVKPIVADSSSSDKTGGSDNGTGADQNNSFDSSTGSNKDLDSDSNNSSRNESSNETNSELDNGFGSKTTDDTLASQETNNRDFSDLQKAGSSFFWNNESNANLDNVEDNSSLLLGLDSDSSNVKLYSDKETYQEALSEAGSSNATNDATTLPKRQHFYQSTPFKVAASTGGGALGIGILAFVFLLLYSGGLLYSLDVNKYRLLGLMPIHHTDKGYCMNLTENMIENSYSSRYRIKLGPVFIKKHSNELIYVHVGKEYLAFNIEKDIIFDLKDS